MNAIDGQPGILVSVEDAGAEGTLAIRTLPRDRSQNCGFLADRELNANEVFLSHAATRVVDSRRCVVSALNHPPFS
jgi:hypothetical protein